MDGREVEVLLDVDTPYWVPLIFSSLDALNFNNLNLTSKVSAFEAAKTESDARIAELEKQVNYNQMVIQHLLKQTDIQEQYSSRECLILHGVPEFEKTEERDREDTDSAAMSVINTNLNVDICVGDINRSHRMGKKVPGVTKPRPIIVKFLRHNVKARVYANKRKLKGTKILITERLTKRRGEMYRYAREQYGKFNVWTKEGDIFAKRDDKIENLTEYLYSISSTISNYSKADTVQAASDS